MKIESLNIFNYLIIALVMVVGVPVLGTIIPKLVLYFSNAIRFRSKKFTDDKKLLNFAISINQKFKNRYSLRYYQDSEIWYMIPLQDEIDKQKYNYLIDKETVVEQTEYLFKKYYQDLNSQNFENINSYFPAFLRCEKYQQNFVKRIIYNPITVFYNPKIVAMAITDFNPEDNIFRVQINAETQSFTISQKGYVLKGQPEVQQYSKYYDIMLVSSDRYLIKGIDDTVSTKMLKQDIQAKLEFFREIT